MKLFFTIFSISFLLTSSLYGVSIKPDAIIIPVSTIGKVTEARKHILQNTLESKLDQYFNIVSKDKVEEAQEKAFMEMDECSESRCFMLIQEYLQIENLFILQVIGEGNDTQLSLKWIDLDKSRVKEDLCINCRTKDLRIIINSLVDSFFLKKEKEKMLLSVHSKSQTTAFRFNLLSSQYSDVSNFRLNFLYGFDKNISGFDFTPIGFSHSENLIDAYQYTILGVNYVKEDTKGYQMVFPLGMNISGNLEGGQIGFYPVGMNVADDVSGFQLGLMSLASANIADDVSGNQIILGFGINIADNIVGGQYSIVGNFATEEINGIQFGLINYAYKLKGIQIGLININWSGTIPVLPILNASW